MKLRDQACNGMNRIILHVEGLPHCPRNRSHAIKRKGKGHFLGKTEAAAQYTKAIHHHLAKYKAQCAVFKAQFNKETQHLIAVWELYSMEVKTISGKYSETGVDLDAHKVLQDSVMDFVGINDAYIVEDTRKKYQGPDAFSVSLFIADNDESNGEELLG